ncbi:MAG: hypothetical protein ACLQDA_01490 [Terracidiphilus sp.]
MRLDECQIAEALVDGYYSSNVGLWEALFNRTGGEAGWTIDVKSRSPFDCRHPPRRTTFAQDDTDFLGPDG